MTSPSKRARLESAGTEHDTNAADERAARAADRHDRSRRRKRARDRPRARRDRSAAGRTPRTLGATEYALVTLIALAVAITIAMAILDPSG